MYLAATKLFCPKNHLVTVIPVVGPKIPGSIPGGDGLGLRCNAHRFSQSPDLRIHQMSHTSMKYKLTCGLLKIST